jgi:fatty-acyl-CoA synthase
MAVAGAAQDNERLAREAWLRALQLTAPIGQDPALILPVVIAKTAADCPGSPALLGETSSLTYGELAEMAGRYAGWALRRGIRRGDVVCLLMRNCPEYMAIWLGITSVGGVVALLNTQLAGDALAHAIGVVAPRYAIVGAGLSEAVDSVRPHLASRPGIWVHGENHPCHPRIEEEIGEPEGAFLRREFPPVTLADRALCIYTSGTTGLPKAANVSHFRIMQWSRWFAGMMDARPSDRMYNCLPMYHSVGGVVATGAMLVSGGSVVVRERFSASRFWDDVAATDCTVFQYIGELCRYLVNSPPHARETAHRLRLSCGNGLRPDVWDAFRRRFRIPQHLEFYAATEANFSLYNCEGEPGSIGRIPGFLAHRFPVALVKFDVEAGEPVRNADGLCVRCAPNEIGEAISKIPDNKSKAGSPFEGYTDKEASAKKVLRDVFTAGDAWFRSGDLMRKDARGYFYFVDRIGDTFRWKGENVSTTQVADAIAACPGVAEAVVYGVALPGADGRAGMAAIVVERGFTFAALRRHLTEALPEYARPLFVRMRGAIDVTATFKQKKQDLANEAYDPGATADVIYLDDRSAGAFVRVHSVLYAKIMAGEVRL